MKNSERYGIRQEKIPWPEVQEINEDGKMTIKYTKEVVYIGLEQFLIGSVRRDLQDTFVTNDESIAFRESLKENENIVVRLIPSQKSDELEFNWTISRLWSLGLEIELTFDHPELVSVYQSKDILQIQFFNSHQFMKAIDASS